MRSGQAAAFTRGQRIMPADSRDGSLEGGIGSIADVCEVTRVASEYSGADLVPAFLIEVPHGATLTCHFDTVRRQLSGPFPDGLEAFFHVNTDVGAPECATAIAEAIIEAPVPDGAGRELHEQIRRRGVLVVRGIVPRTFVDCNRIIDSGPDSFREGGVTAGIPSYMTGEADREIVRGLYQDYRTVAEAAYRRVCGSGGLAVTLHSYAPRSIDVEVDGDIVERLREAYSAGTYEEWPVRPDVDIIGESAEGNPLAPSDLVEAIKRQYGKIGIDVSENGTYRLHPSTMGYHHSATHADHVICIELSRALLADPFDPFVEMRIGANKVERMSKPIAQALLEVAVNRLR